MSIKHWLPLEEAKGEVLSQDLYGRYGNLILAKNTVLNDYAIERLKSENIKRILVYPSYGDEENIESRRFNLLYKESVIAMKELMGKLVSEESSSYTKLKEISDKIYYEDKNMEQFFEDMKGIDDDYTYNHCINVALYSMYIAQLLGFCKERTKDIIQAGLLHDIGKAKIPKKIINKKGKLDDKEFRIIKTHTFLGYEMAKNIPIKEEIRQAILMHHEREDGSGYPYGLKSDEINMYAKILAIADVYDALTSERVYKEKVTPFDAIEEFYKMGIEQFSKPILSIFFKNIVQCYINLSIKLNNGEVGKIVYIPPYNITSPVINIGGRYIDLDKHPSLQVMEVI